MRKQIMQRHLLYRNIYARELLDLFLLSAIGTVLVIRTYLHLTGYPQIGGGSLHIAHILYGGILMAAGSALNYAFLGLRAQRLAAFVGGVGFGFFIDEIGKVVTSDNDYFFRPAVGIIYAVFVILYLTFNFLSRRQRLTSREYQLNALIQLEEAIVHHMDPTEKERAHRTLRKADQNNAMTKGLQNLLENVDLVPEDQPPLISRFLGFMDRTYTNFWLSRSSNPLIRTFFVVESLIFVGIVSWGIVSNLDDIPKLFAGTASYDYWLYIGQIVSSVVAATYALVGALLITRSRTRAFEQFRRATLINLFLTEFFIFSRVEFRALPGFLFQVGVLLFITYSIHLERRHQNRTTA
jgi:hypothetical protein